MGFFCFFPNRSSYISSQSFDSVFFYLSNHKLTSRTLLLFLFLPLVGWVYLFALLKLVLLFSFALVLLIFVYFGFVWLSLFVLFFTMDFFLVEFYLSFLNSQKSAFLKSSFILLCFLFCFWKWDSVKHLHLLALSGTSVLWYNFSWDHEIFCFCNLLLLTFLLLLNY